MVDGKPIGRVARLSSMSIVAIAFLPLSFVTGLPGINIDGIHGAENELGFLIVVVVLSVVVIGFWALFSWRRWF